MKPSIFIAATNQHEGKTTSCLGILSGLLKKYKTVGFIKPVGQEHVTVNDSLVVDKDVVLFKKCFDLPGKYEEMSPIIFKKGYTKECIDNKIDNKQIENKIVTSFKSQEDRCECMLIEGTGHVGVGSIAEISNARVASILNTEVVMVTSGGIGSSFDLLSLSKAMFEKHNVKIAGVILNRVIDDKLEMIKDYMTRALKRWDIPLLGCIPYEQFLTTPTMKDFETLFSTSLITGKEHKLRHFRTNRLVATSVESYEKLIKPCQLVITPSSREDIVFSTLKAHWNYKIENPDSDLKAGFIFTGSSPPSEHITSQIDKAQIPMLYANKSSFLAMKMITGFTAKINFEDQKKVQEAISVMEKNINFDLLCEIMEKRSLKSHQR